MTVTTKYLFIYCCLILWTIFTDGDNVNNYSFRIKGSVFNGATKESYLDRPVLLVAMGIPLQLEEVVTRLNLQIKEELMYMIILILLKIGSKDQDLYWVTKRIVILVRALH
jgi:hypothetical protein